MSTIKIYPESAGSWTVVCDNDEFQADEVQIRCDSKTGTVIDGHGNMTQCLVCEDAVVVFYGAKILIRPMKQQRKFFVITGLPRTRTAWMAALMSGERSICFHEPKNIFGSWNAFFAYATTLDYEYIGISDSSVTIDPLFDWSIFQMAKIVMIDRNPEDVIDSYSNVMDFSHTEAADLVLRVYDGLNQLVAKHEVMHVGYDALESIATVAAIWDYCLPGIRIPEEKIKQMQYLRVEQHIEKVLKHMQSR